MTKFKGANPPKDREYGYISIAFFGDDKEDLIQVLNHAKLPYSSLNHFMRAAVNSQLKHHGIDFQITER